MTTAINTPAREKLTTDFQSYLAPLTDDRYEHFFRKGVEKAATIEDVYNQRNKITDQFNSYAVSLVKAEANKDTEAVSSAKGSIAALKAMELGFEAGIRAEL